MKTTKRMVPTVAALFAICAMLVAGCTSPVTPAVSFSAEKLTISLPPMVVGTAVTETLPEAMGGEQDLVYSLSPTVPGLTFDRATRVLSGTPTTAGTYAMTYTATDPATGGTMESVKFTITVPAVPLTNAELVRGTWAETRGWYEDDGHRGTLVDMLTFTASRFVFVRGHFDDSGAFVYAWQQEGTWEITDDEAMVRTWLHDDDDDDSTPAVLAHLSKSYVLTADDLIINSWDDESGDAPGSAWMMRVTDPALSQPPIGAWTRDDDGNIHTMTLAPDGTFTWTHEEEAGTWTMSATWEHDPDEHFINLSNVTETWTETGGEPVPDERLLGIPFVRVAYAPVPQGTDGDQRLRVSDWGAEAERAHGGYWGTMTLDR